MISIRNALVNLSYVDKRRPENSIPDKRGHRWIRVMYVSVVGGVLSNLMGLVMSGLALIGALEQTPVFKTIATLMIAASFPLLFLAAHSMDKADAADKAIRREYCRQHGMKDKDC